LEVLVAGAVVQDDRKGQLTMRNLDIADTRAKLELYAGLGTLPAGEATLVGEISPGGAESITANPAVTLSGDEVLDQAAIESGVD
jgi:argininosuccinate synthase